MYSPFNNYITSSSTISSSPVTVNNNYNNNLSPLASSYYLNNNITSHGVEVNNNYNNYTTSSASTITSPFVEVNNYNNNHLSPSSLASSYYLINNSINNNYNNNLSPLASSYYLINNITSHCVEVNNINKEINYSLNPQQQQTNINNLNLLTITHNNNEVEYSNLINNYDNNISPLISSYCNEDNDSIRNNYNCNDNNYIIIDESGDYINNRTINIEKEKTNKNNYQIVKEIGDFQFECKYGDKKLNEMNEIDREVLKIQFKTFAYSARNVIFNLMSINGYKYKRNVVVGCIDSYVFYYFFKEMEGAKFKKCYENLKKNGLTEKVPCIRFKFNNILPVLHNVNTWGMHSYTANIIGRNNEEYITKYKLNIEYITFKCNLHTYIVKTTFKYKQETIFEQ